MGLTIPNFAKTVPTDLVSEGERIFKQGNVKNVKPQTDGGWIAEVATNGEIYNVEILLDDVFHILDHFCDCPSETDFCKHQAATFWKLKEILPKVVKEKSKAKTKEITLKKKKLSPIDAILEETSLLELHGFIKKALGNKEFKNMFLVHFADKGEIRDRKYYSDVLRTAATNIKRTGNLTVKDTKRYLPTVVQIWEKAEQSMRLNLYKEYAPILLAILETLIPQHQRLSDNDGKIHTIIRNSFTALSQFYVNAQPNLSLDILNEMTEMLNISLIHAHFRSELLKLFRQIAKIPHLQNAYIRYLDKILKDKSQNDYIFGDFSSFGGETNLQTDIVDLKREFYNANNLADKIPQLLAENQNIDRFRKEYIAYLWNKKDYQEVKKVLEKLLFSKKFAIRRGAVDNFWLEKLEDANEKLGDNEGLVAALVQHFILTDFEMFSVLKRAKSLSSPEKWEEIFNKLQKEILNKHQNSISTYGWSRIETFPVKLGNLLVFDERWEELKSLIEKKDQLEGYARFGQYLLLNYEESTIKFYKNNLKKWISIANYTPDYENIVTILANLNSISEEGRTYAEEIKTFILTVYKTRRNFVNLVNSVLK